MNFDMSKVTIDLHCHTDFSDSSMSVADVIREAKKKCVIHLAITDHDTTSGIKKALDIGAKFGVNIVPGIEISAYDFKRNKRVHILGYYVQPDHCAIKEICEPLVKSRNQASKKMVEILIQKGYKITWSQVCKFAGHTGVFKQHIMCALKESGYCNELYGELYKKLFSRGEKGFFGLAYVPVEYVDAIKAIKAINSAGGVAVLAHPGQFDNFDAVPDFVKAGLGGIEVRHPCHDKEKEERAMKLCYQFGLVATGGSDFHGSYTNHKFVLGSKSPALEALMSLKEKADLRGEEVKR